MPNGHVSCMVDDYMGSIWVGNNVGVMTIRNGQEAFYNYLLVGNCNSVCRLNDGRLLWSNSWGLIFFDPAAVKATKRKKRVTLTDIADRYKGEWRSHFGGRKAEWTGGSFRSSGKTGKTGLFEPQ